MLKVKNIGSNMTEVETGKTTILISYETPVAAMNLSPEWHEKYGASIIRTSQKWSQTTSRHINKWLDGARATEVDQSVLDNLL